MPELPEVETVVRGLREALPGRGIVSVRLGKTDFIEDPAALGELLPGRRIEAVERIGKFIRMKLTAGAEARSADVALNLMVHLGMTGRLLVRPASEAIAPHTHGFFELDDGRELRYTDIRRFGQIRLVAEAALEGFYGQLGREPLEVSREEFASRLRGRRARIKALLLDQGVFRGIGNIYADESLWRSRIHPARLAETLSAAELSGLWRAVQSVLRTAMGIREATSRVIVPMTGLESLATAAARPLRARSSPDAAVTSVRTAKRRLASGALEGPGLRQRTSAAKRAAARGYGSGLRRRPQEKGSRAGNASRDPAGDSGASDGGRPGERGDRGRCAGAARRG